MSEVNIDADLVRTGGSELSQTDEKLVEMTNGCICCTLRDDLLAEVRRLAEQDRFDYLLIESTGISEPLPVAATFDFRDEDGQSLGDIAKLDTMVTVVDAARMIADYSSTDMLTDRGESLGDEDNRSIVDLLVDQIEFADVIVMNKLDLISDDDRKTVLAIIKALNADAEVIETSNSIVAPERILNTGRFDFDRAQNHPLWAKELYGFADHVPETEEYGIKSFTFRTSLPFHPERFHEFINSEWPGVSAGQRAISGWPTVRTGSGKSVRQGRRSRPKPSEPGGVQSRANNGQTIRHGAIWSCRNGTRCLPTADRKSFLSGRTSTRPPCAHGFQHV